MTAPRKANGQFGDRGAALLTAIALLALFSLLGTAYVTYMGVVLEKAYLDMRSLQARHMARGGVEAAIGQLQAVLYKPEPVRKLLASGLEIEFPVYRVDRSNPLGFSPNDRRRGAVKVAITDESGRINLNHAPLRVLRAVLRVDPEKARKILDSLPRTDAGETAARARKWLAGVDDLVNYGLMDAEAFEAVSRDWITVHTVADHSNPREFLNVNAASPHVLAAILNIHPKAAKEITSARPFKNQADLSAAAQKALSTFNYKPAPETPDQLPKELCFESRCFRIVSEATLSNLGPNDSEYRKTPSRVEAVVTFGDKGPQITYWSERRKS